MFPSFYTRALCQASENVPVASEQPQGLVNTLVSTRKIAAAAVAEGESCEFASPHYFVLCGLGGELFGFFLCISRFLKNLLVKF